MGGGLVETLGRLGRGRVLEPQLGTEGGFPSKTFPGSNAIV